MNWLHKKHARDAAIQTPTEFPFDRVSKIKSSNLYLFERAPRKTEHPPFLQGKNEHDGNFKRASEQTTRGLHQVETLVHNLVLSTNHTHSEVAFGQCLI